MYLITDQQLEPQVLGPQIELFWADASGPGTIGLVDARRIRVQHGTKGGIQVDRKGYAQNRQFSHKYPSLSTHDLRQLEYCAPHGPERNDQRPLA
jgi:hypothetical protein